MYDTIQKTIIAWAFNHIAYYYFDNVDISQVAFENGEIELLNLPVKRGALRHLKLPWDVVNGVIGKISIRLPLLTLLTDPWLIKISDLMLIVENSKNDPDDQSIEIIQEEIEDDFSVGSEEIKLAEFYASFSSKVSDIYKNIKLEIEKITILYENYKLNANSLLLHRRKINTNNVSLFIGNYLLRIDFDVLSLELHDEEINSETNVNGKIYVVGNSSIPICEFLLEDLRILYFSSDHQRDWSVFARASCSHFNRENSTWDVLLKPWPFNFSWDRLTNQKKISLTSDERAEFTVSNALLDLVDVVLKRISTGTIPTTSIAVDPIFVLHNQTGHRLFYVILDEFNDLTESSNRSKSSSPIDRGDSISHAILHKLSIGSRSSGEDGDSNVSEFNRSTKWSLVENDENVVFGIAKSILVRVEGWKTLLPIPLDKTGLFFREACSDRVKYEDTYVVISIDLEDKSARKIISIRSPLNLVNKLDTTLEVHLGCDHTLYMKPESQVSVPLPYLFSQIYIRPCNVGVTMSEQPIVWDKIIEVPEIESRIHICQPITITDKRHASYCTSQAYRICASLHREAIEKELLIQPGCMPNPVFQITFLPPLTIVNLLPCELKYFVDGIHGSLGKGGQQKIYRVDTTQMNEVQFELNGFLRSKSVKINACATGSFQYTLEMIDKNHRSLYLNAKVILASLGEEPAVQVMISAPFWFINKTKLPLILKQEGAALEAAGQYREHEDRPASILLFSFYDTELEPPWLCCMRLGKSKGASVWCDGFKLEKGSGQRRLSFIQKNVDGDSKLNKSLIDINIRRGYGRYSDTLVVTLTSRHGFDALAKTPKKTFESSPQDNKLSHYNYSTNLAQQIGGRSVRQLFTNHKASETDLSFVTPGLEIILVDKHGYSLMEITFENVTLKSTTRSREQIVDCSIQDILIKNALPDCERNTVLARSRNMTSSPALRLIMDRIIGKSFGTVWFRQVQLSMCELMLNIEERLFLKLVEFISFRNTKRRQEDNNNLARDLDRLLHPEEDRLSKYYFDLLRIDLRSLEVSCYTTTNLASSLQKLKSYLDLKFFSFEDAHLHLSPYFKMNVSRTMRGIFDSITRFYKRQISEQAPRMVGQQIQNYLWFHLSDLLSSLYDEVYNKLFY